MCKFYREVSEICRKCVRAALQEINLVVICGMTGSWERPEMGKSIKSLSWILAWDNGLNRVVLDIQKLREKITGNEWYFIISQSRNDILGFLIYNKFINFSKIFSEIHHCKVLYYCITVYIKKVKWYIITLIELPVEFFIIKKAQWHFYFQQKMWIR